MRHNRSFLFATAIYLIELSIVTVSAQVTWIQTNGPNGGNISDIIVTPQENLFARSQLGRLYRSTDQGESWAQLSADIGDLFLWSIACDSAGSVFVGTGAGEIYKSTNGGDRWTALAKVPTQKEMLTVAVSIEGHLFAGTGGTTIFPAQGPFRSTDGGASWHTLQIDPQAVSLFDMLFAPSGRIYALTGKGLYRSADNGLSWVNLWAQNGSSIAMNSFGHLFVGTSFGGYPGMYRSTDDGQTWAQINAGLATPVVRSVVIDGSNTIYAGTDGGVYSSRDNGESWQSLTANFSREDIHSVVINEQGFILAGTNLGSQFGIIRSVDGGQSWHGAGAGLINVKVYSLAADSTGNIYATGTYGGLWKSTDRGATWVKLGLANYIIGVVAIDLHGYVFVGYSQKIFRSTDSGATWSETALMDSIPLPTVRQFAFSALGYGYAATSNGIYRSSDSGQSWHRTNINFSDFNGRSLLILPSGETLAGTTNGLFRSVDNGESWTKSAFENENIGSLGTSPRGYLFATTLYGGVYRSHDGGVSWTQMNTGLPRPTSPGPNIPIEHQAINSGGDIYVTVGSYGVYVSTNHGESWISENDALTDTKVQALTFDPSGYLYAGTENSGVFRTTQSTITSIDTRPAQPTAFLLEQNYPNPFNPETRLRFGLPVMSDVTIAVFDVLGREVITLENASFSAGHYSTVWKGINATGEHVSSGVYFARFIAISRSRQIFTNTVKMVLAK